MELEDYWESIWTHTQTRQSDRYTYDIAEEAMVGRLRFLSRLGVPE